jgi:hypothetical protein
MPILTTSVAVNNSHGREFRGECYRDVSPTDALLAGCTWAAVKCNAPADQVAGGRFSFAPMIASQSMVATSPSTKGWIAE